MRMTRSLFLLTLPALLVAQQPPTMSVNEIRPGMKGTGRTVFQGGKIDKFTFEVMGVQRNAGPGHSIIWVKAAGGPLAETGILQGMSGSPCYIDGKLIGAIALAPTFGKDTLGGVTPIGEMLDQLKDIPDTPSLRTPLLLPKLEPPKVLKAALKGEMIPLATLLGGLEEETFKAPLPLVGTTLGAEARSFWQGTPVRFLSAPTLSHTAGMEASPLEPGGMMSISLLQGDMDMAASGTITYVNGKRLMGFGHPLMGLGAVDLPLWSASVLASVPVLSNSYKLSVPVAPVGALRLDRNAGVAGTLGAEAKMIPLRVGLNLGGKRTFNYKFEIMDHPLLAPILAATVVSQVLTTQVRGAGFQSLALQGNVKLANHQPIQVEHMVADVSSNRTATFVGGLMQAILMNPYERPVVEGASFTIKAEERLDLTQLAGVRLLKHRAKRGEVLPVVVTLQDIQGVRETATLNVPIPSSARKGPATLLVGDGLSLLATDPDERKVETTSLADVVKILNNALRNNHAYALVVQNQAGAGLLGSRLEGIPPTISGLLGADGDSQGNGLTRRVVGRAVLPLEREVRGLLSLELEIE